MGKLVSMSKIYVIALVLSLSIATFLAVLPHVYGQEIPTRRVKTYAYIGAIPNPVGVNQEVLLHFGITAYLEVATDGWQGLTVTVERPDGKTETLGPFKTDSTGGTGRIYVPPMVGTYYLQAHFPAQRYNWTTPARASIWYEASDSEKLALIVQEEPLPYYPGFSLPTEYWTRPIDSQIREWSTISGSLLDAWPYVPEDPKMRVAPYNDGPEVPHILWAKPLLGGGFGALGGGLAGGEVDEHGFETGDAYEGLFTPPVVIAGVLYFNRYKADGSTRVEQEVVAVDLRTGEEIWVRNWSNNRLAFGQLFYWDNYNYHAVFAYLWATVGTTWHAYEASTGRWVYSVTNVPSGSRIRGPSGEILVYTVNVGRGWMTKWNSTRVVTQTRINQTGPAGQQHGSWLREYMGTTFDGIFGIEWNVTIPTGIPAGVRAVLEDRILLSNDYRWSTQNYAIYGDYTLRLACLSTRSGGEGTLLFNTTWTPPQANVSSAVLIASLEDGVFVVGLQEMRALVGFSLDTGRQVWGPTESQHYMEIFTICNDRRGVNAIYDGILYKGGMSGIVYAYNVKTGELLWKYELKDPYNEILWSNYWPVYFAFATDGKIYIFHSEHSVIDPKPRGAPFVCLDAKSGEEIWSINIRGHHWGGYPVIGDSIIAIYNTYDQRVYAIGKGPTATKVTATPEIVANGQSILIKGTVMDISAGTEDSNIALRFPNGVPAVADESMSEWMEYVYLQHPRPSDVKGVWVTFDVVSPEGEWIHVGGTHTDDTGMFSIPWTPPSEGLWTIVITFPGSKAYYASYAQTSLLVTAAPPTPETPEIPAPPDYTMIFAALALLVIIAILVGVYCIYSIRKLRK